MSHILNRSTILFHCPTSLCAMYCYVSLFVTSKYQFFGPPRQFKSQIKFVECWSK